MILLDEGKRDAPAALCWTVIDGLDVGTDMLVEIRMDGEPEPAFDPRLAEGLPRTLEPASSSLSGLAATGGETAALLARFGITGIRLADEIEPGVSLGLPLGSTSLPIVTKPGAFGGHGSLARVTRCLRSVRQKGELV